MREKVNALMYFRKNAYSRNEHIFIRYNHAPDRKPCSFLKVKG